MGRWFVRFLKHEGHEVIVTGRNQDKLIAAHNELRVTATTDSIQAVREADAVILSVSIDNFEAVVKELGPHTHDGQIIADLTSVKTMPVAQMHRYIKAGIILGGHPVFGPGAKDLTARSLILTPTNSEEEALANKVKTYLEARGARVSLMSPEEHDEIMMVILGLAHYIAIVSADTLESLDRLPQMGEIGGITFKLLLTLTQSVVSEDPDFYASLQMNLPGMASLEQDFCNRAKAWADLVESKDKHGFAIRMRQLKERFGRRNADLGNSYEDMYKFIEALQKPKA